MWLPSFYPFTHNLCHFYPPCTCACSRVALCCSTCRLRRLDSVWSLRRCSTEKPRVGQVVAQKIGWCLMIFSSKQPRKTCRTRLPKMSFQRFLSRGKPLDLWWRCIELFDGATNISKSHDFATPSCVVPRSSCTMEGHILGVSPLKFRPYIGLMHGWYLEDHPTDHNWLSNWNEPTHLFINRIIG